MVVPNGLEVAPDHAGTHRGKEVFDVTRDDHALPEVLFRSVQARTPLHVGADVLGHWYLRKDGAQDSLLNIFQAKVRVLNGPILGLSLFPAFRNLEAFVQVIPLPNKPPQRFGSNPQSMRQRCCIEDQRQFSILRFEFLIFYERGFGLSVSSWHGSHSSVSVMFLNRSMFSWNAVLASIDKWSEHVSDP